MAGAKFQYDESGGTFLYFLLSFEALVVIPCTYYFWPHDATKQEKKRDRRESVCHCENCRIKNSRLSSKEPWRKAKQRLIKVVLLTAWAFLLYTAYRVAHLQHDYVAYDPFEILQIPPGATMADIKKAYRRLSLVYHPDKETGDEKKFMMIAKAYAALTDEEARKNLELYGNPDGPGATSFGIALPSWIVEKENSIWVLGLYALVFMVALPVAVAVWWFKSVKYGCDQVLFGTTQFYLYFIHKTPHMVLRRVIMIIAASLEFSRNHNSEIVEKPSDNTEVPKLIRELSNLGEKNRENPLCYGYSIKARALIHAHLSRIKISNTLEEDKLYVVKKCPYLIQEFVQCASQLTVLALSGKIPRMPNLDTMEYAMKLCPLIVQALWDNKSALLQLPYINDDMLRHFTTRRRNIRNIQNLACMKSDDRRAMLRSLNDDQYDDVLSVIARMPVITLEVMSEVLDDEDSCTITAGAIVTVTATLFRKNMSSLFDQGASPSYDNCATEEIEKDGEHQNLPNGDISPKVKTKSWEKKKKYKKSSKVTKKKGAGAKNKEEKSAVSAASKKESSEQKQESSHHEKSEKKTNPEKDDDSGNSNSESDSNTDVCNNHSYSYSYDQDEKVKQDKCDNEEDAEWEKFQQKVSRKEKVLETKSKKSHSVHCPFYPEDKQEFWWVYLADKRRHVLITAPYLITNLVEREEVELKFTAPPKPGIYTYSVIVRSDSYIDFDIIKAIKLDVKEAKEVDVAKIQWDVSEEEEEKEEEESAVEDSDLASDEGDESD